MMKVREKSLPVSACILCKNEADRLERCLKPLSVFAETLVVDTGSSDGSQDLLRQHHVTWFEDPWVNFSVNRKRLFERASQPWILWLDADEVVTEPLIAELQAFLADVPEKIEGAEVNRMVFFEGQWIRHGAWFPDWCMRLFRSNAWTLSDDAVHESLTIRGETVRLENYLEHYSFRSWDDLKKRSLFYESLWLEERYSSSKRVSKRSGHLHAVSVFLKDYIFKQGFLDGKIGFDIAKHRTHEVWRKYRKLYDMGRERQG